MNLYGYGNGDPINNSDPFGLCPKSGGGDGKTDDTSDCPRGTSGWWAHRDAQGEGNSLVNNAMGFLAMFGADMRAQLPEGTLSGEFNLPIGPGSGAAAVGGRITGYTRHGLNQAISNDGVGVAAAAILSAVRNPLQAVSQAKGAIMYSGEHATVVLNREGRVITTWATSRAGWRITP